MRKEVVGIVMGSDSDLPTMEGAIALLKQFKVPHEVRVVSAHRTPKDMAEYGEKAHSRGLKVLIAGAGGAAHLPGMLASHTILPVIGVPVKSKNLQGLDSLLSIVQMPPGIPVATMAIEGSKNAALLAVEILALSDATLCKKLLQFREKQSQESREKNKKL